MMNQGSSTCYNKASQKGYVDSINIFNDHINFPGACDSQDVSWQREDSGRAT